MNKIIQLSLATCLLTVLTGCEPQYHKPQKNSKEKVITYKVHSSDSNDWIYYYVLYDSVTRNYYYTSSLTPISSYSSVDWSSSSQKPAELTQEQTELVEAQEVSVEELGADFAQDMSADYSNIPENNSLDSMEGVNDTSSNDTSSSDSSSSSSDSGSSDSSGGDSGGGSSE